MQTLQRLSLEDTDRQSIDNSEIFGRVLFSQNFAYFVRLKSSRNAQITLSFTDICKSRTSCEFLASQICLLTLFTKIKILAKISRFTVQAE